MAELIDRESQDWLLDALKALVDAQGADHFLNAPILEPTSKYFPDEWEASIRGVEILLKRLLLYAGLEQLQPEVRVFSQASEIYEFNEFGSPKSWGHQNAAAWFAGIEGKRCFFGVAAENIDEPEILVASLCHEVAHAWRVVNGSAVDDSEEEELLTDVSTVYLGFGLFTTNASYRYRTSGHLSGTLAYHRWSHHRLGYLPPNAMSFLLAAQSMARGMGWWERRRLSGRLETNQAYYYRRSVKILRRCQDLNMRFSIAAPAGRPPAPPATPRHIRLSLPDHASDRTAVIPRLNEGWHVYRVKRNKELPYAFWGAVAGSMLGAAAMYGGWGWWAFLAGNAIGGALGSLAGHSRPWDYCSDPHCQAEIPTDALECPRCGGEVRGAIAHPDERLERDENL